MTAERRSGNTSTGQQSARADEPERTVERSSGPPRGHARLFALQRQAGNGAVTSALRGAAVARQVDPTLGFDPRRVRIERLHAEQRRLAAIVRRGLQARPRGDFLSHEVLYRNACEAVHHGRLRVQVLEPTHDSDRRRPGARAFFDGTVWFPNVGGSYPAVPSAAEAAVPTGSMPAVSPTVPVVYLSGGVDGITDRNRVSIVDASIRSDDYIIRAIIHESQHALDRSDPGDVDHRPLLAPGAANHLANLYQSEFRAYWVEAFGLPTDVFGPESAAATNRERVVVPGGAQPGGQPTAFVNLRQEQIFWHMLRSGGYAWVAGAYVNDPAFRSMVNGLTRPSGVNLVNSVRIDAFVSAVRACPSPVVPGSPPDRAVELALDRLDGPDREFLRSDMSEPLWRLVESHFGARTSLLLLRLERLDRSGSRRGDADVTSGGARR